jgi:hypothetical protein
MNGCFRRFDSVPFKLHGFLVQFSCTELNGNEQQDGKYPEWGDLFEYNFRNFAWKYWGKPEQFSAYISGGLVGLRKKASGIWNNSANYHTAVCHGTIKISDSGS